VPASPPMFEHSPHPPLLSRRAFVHRVGRSTTLAALLIGGSLGIGVLGYHLTANLAWIDALLNASMILTGMGPVSPLYTTGAKLFASLYALFSGVIFIASVGVVVAPLAHRLLHRFHIEVAGRRQDGGRDDGERDGRGDRRGGPA
jgi:hypothetical protein